MIKISKIAFEVLKDSDGNISMNPIEWWKKNKMACIWSLLCMVVQIPLIWLRYITMLICFVPHVIYVALDDMRF